MKRNLMLVAILAAMFPTSGKAISEKLSQDEYDAFAADAQEAQNRLDAQTEGNQAVAADLTAANARIAELEAAATTASTDLATAQADLATAQATNVALTAKADKWDAYKASLTGASLQDDATNRKGKVVTAMSDNEEARVSELQRLKAQYPSLMADVDVPVAEVE